MSRRCSQLHLGSVVLREAADLQPTKGLHSSALLASSVALWRGCHKYAALTSMHACIVLCFGRHRWKVICEGVSQCHTQAAAVQRGMDDEFAAWRELLASLPEAAGTAANSARTASRQHLRAMTADLVALLEQAGAACTRLGGPVDLAGYEVEVPQWLPASVLNALVERETRAERRETRQLLADHLKLQVLHACRVLLWACVLVRRHFSPAWRGGNTGQARHIQEAAARSEQRP